MTKCLKPDLFQHILKKLLPKHELELWQNNAINHIINARYNDDYEKKNAFILQPTGSGKSLCFQIPILYDILQTPEKEGLHKNSLGIIISPLIALMEDQYNNLLSLKSMIE